MVTGKEHQKRAVTAHLVIQTKAQARQIVRQVQGTIILSWQTVTMGTKLIGYLCSCSILVSRQDNAHLGQAQQDAHQINRLYAVIPASTSQVRYIPALATRSETQRGSKQVHIKDYQESIWDQRRWLYMVATYLHITGRNWLQTKQHRPMRVH